MGIKDFRPLTPVQRFTSLDDFSDITKTEPEWDLTEPYKKKGGRNNYGRITARHRGGGHKQRYRIIDFKRDKTGIFATVEAIEYDPLRTARIALLRYDDQEKRYIIAPQELKVGSRVVSGPDAPPEVGNSLPLKNIPSGLPIYNIELVPGKGGQLVRSAGSSARMMGLDKEYAIVKLPSGEIRKVCAECYATVGQVSNPDHFNKSLGKAGRTRWLGWRPRVRGVAMNPVDHPNGGGQGKSKGGGGWQQLESPWGKPAKGKKTRHKRKNSTKFIIERRPKKKKKK
ncbi:50S ribosomal protein L2 [Candidatus Methylacidiphilum infernorum]|uniref:Large ribosomal subunit protein uL2 n=1 Tax=Methylacidiphilum infernorum (isolate V4) TaxID=481448 RepID=RL2_METI4|nr:50S ribosomal protein L2 [Candidatus Methylacidiphilum infernorum]B3E0I7.1 RecName: Full=Large ribosomal subunit protein uL2; AltName: Full=50S ribosomal protein L2 [Methylacidiphilum infernorum V4]ACD82741.1 Ribosomal protein L2 [Methylacidiphilum infernorum V4]